MNEVIAIIAFTVFLCGCGVGFYQFIIKPIGKAHYQTIDKAINDGILNKNPTRDEVITWIKNYDAYPHESAIKDTMKYISKRQNDEAVK